MTDDIKISTLQLIPDAGAYAVNIAIFADTEGSFGVWRMRQWWSGGEDLNLKIKADFDDMASAVIVKDTHYMGCSCIVDRLDKRAKCAG